MNPGTNTAIPKHIAYPQMRTTTPSSSALDYPQYSPAHVPPPTPAETSDLRPPAVSIQEVVKVLNQYLSAGSNGLETS
ncbi:hypothetical protein CVT26_006695 [Gymnopilus dilepis]|uniref:Uncharacterized protein n=1 Tax=Gymnopilus dilepis TaxID=231916 RepID=A0A409Y2X3_9AGAR|nr:hypothetical protein CVT26_006695 [Gymnopilus dilepis]